MTVRVGADAGRVPTTTSRANTGRRSTQPQQRRRRLILIGVAAAALLATGVLIALMQPPARKADAGTLTGSAQAVALVSALPQSGLTLGRPGAAISVTEFSDMQCPFCAQFANESFPGYATGPLAKGESKMRFVPISILGPDSEKGALAALAAARQNRLWQFVGVWYANQGQENSGYVTDAFIDKVAVAAGLDMTAFHSALADPALAAAARRDLALARAKKIQSTPSFVVRGPRGEQVVAGADTAKLGAAIAAVQ